MRVGIRAVCWQSGTYCLSEEGEVWYFGSGGFLEPTKLCFTDQRIVDISCGANEGTVTFLTEMGEVWIGERGDTAQPIDCPPLAMIQSGDYHQVGIDFDQQLWVFGSNAEEQLGVVEKMVTKPVVHPSFRTKVEIVACGTLHTLVSSVDGDVYAFGNNTFGQLGVGDFLSRHEPTKITLHIGERIQAIACGTDHTVIHSIEGNCYVAGSNHQSQLTPHVLRKTWRNFEKLEEVSGEVEYISCCDYATIFVDTFGRLLVHGSVRSRDRRNPFYSINKLLENSSEAREQIVSISSTGSHLLFKQSTGTIWACGCNDEGQLGLGFSNPYFHPIRALSERYSHCMASGVHKSAKSAYK